MKIRPAGSRDVSAAKRLLAGCQLPCADITVRRFRHFFCCLEGKRLVGVVGLEVCRKDALLRSLAVSEPFRGRGLGRQLVAHAEKHAQSLRIKSLYLLTTTAQDFFARLGYQVLHRATVPNLIRETQEFASLCPDCAVCMTKRLQARPATNLVPDEITTDRARMDVDLIHGFLRSSYWAKDVPRRVVERSIQHSLCFGAFYGGKQIAFGRVITDRATFAYLADVFVMPEHRGRGVSKRMMETILAHPELQGLRRLLLATADAHGLYAQFGFKPLANPEKYMTIHNPHVYRAHS